MARKSVSSFVLTLPIVAIVIFFGWTGFETALGQEPSPPTERYTWPAPTYGTPVAYYVVEARMNRGDILPLGRVDEPAIEIELHQGPVDNPRAFIYGNLYEIRAAAVDSAGVQGPYSVWSLPFSPEVGPPRLTPQK